MALVRWSEPGAVVMLAGGMIYVVGMFICTLVYNVPLNNEVSRAGTGSAEVWARYLLAAEANRREPWAIHARLPRHPVTYVPRQTWRSGSFYPFDTISDRGY